jgi:hypothetical protein
MATDRRRISSSYACTLRSYEHMFDSATYRVETSIRVMPPASCLPQIALAWAWVLAWVSAWGWAWAYRGRLDPDR